MSWVANLIIAADRQDRETVEAFDLWLREEAPTRERHRTGVGSLASITEPDTNQWGGWKNPECAVWAGALNHADLGALLSQVTQQPWRFPGRLQVLLMDQEESYFRLWMFRDGELRQYAPPPPPDADEQHPW